MSGAIGRRDMLAWGRNVESEEMIQYGGRGSTPSILTFVAKASFTRFDGCEDMHCGLATANDGPRTKVVLG
jgi:hypothetical protein